MYIYGNIRTIAKRLYKEIHSKLQVNTNGILQNVPTTHWKVKHREQTENEK
jgi:hypothetical protein